MDSKPELTAEQLERIAKLTEMGGEVLFEASAGYSFHARGAMRLLAHILGQLYGETIRQTRGYDGLKDEVQTTFMCGMALEPNFGREDAPEYKKLEKLPAHLRKALLEGSWEERTPGQALYEEERARKPGIVAWDRLHPSYHEKYEAKAKANAEKDDTERVQAMFDKGTPLPTGTYRIKGTLRLPSGVTGITVKASAKDGAKSPGQLLFEKECGSSARSWDKLPLSCRIAYENKATREIDAKAEHEPKVEEPAKKCFKCQGSGNMGFSMFVTCDAC